MKKFIVALMCLMNFAPAHAEDSALRPVLEKLISDARTAIETQNYEQYTGITTPYEKAKTAVQPKEQWVKQVSSDPGRRIYLFKTPDVKKITFLKVTEAAPYAFYYYADENYDATDNIIGALVFKKEGASWKIYGRNATSSKPKAELKTKEDMLKIIETDALFSTKSLVE